MAEKIRAIATVGFFRGDLVEPGTILELTPEEFAMHQSFNQVDYAPAAPPPPPPAEKPAKKAG